MASILLLVSLTGGGLTQDQGAAGSTRLAYSDFLTKVENGEVKDVIVRENAESGTKIQGHFSNGEAFALQAVNDPRLVDTLRAHNVKLAAASPSSGADSFLGIFLSSWLPFLLLIGVYIFFMRQMQGKNGGGGGAMGFGKSRAKLLNEHTKKKTFEDVAGIDEVKEELQEIVEFLKNPQKFAVHTQIDLHAEYGGVVPELASRDHIRRLVPLIRQVLRESGATLDDVDAIAYTAGPGLAGALLVGTSVAESLASSRGIPALPIHHLEGHLLSPMLSVDPPGFPFVALLVSGGHTQLMRVGGVGDYELLGESLDDARG